MKGLPSYADISLLIMHVIKSDEINDKINELISSELDTETAETKAREIEMVNSTNEPENLVDLCRKVTDFHAKTDLSLLHLSNAYQSITVTGFPSIVFGIMISSALLSQPFILTPYSVTV